MTLLPPGSVVVRATEAVRGRQLAAPAHLPPGIEIAYATGQPQQRYTAPCPHGAEGTWTTRQTFVGKTEIDVDCPCEAAS